MQDQQQQLRDDLREASEIVVKYVREVVEDNDGQEYVEIAADLMVWASDRRMEEDWGMCRLIASLTASTD